MRKVREKRKGNRARRNLVEKLQKKSRKKRLKEKLEKLQVRMEERHGMVEKFQEQEQLVDREKF